MAMNTFGRHQQDNENHFDRCEDLQQTMNDVYWQNAFWYLKTYEEKQEMYIIIEIIVNFILTGVNGQGRKKSRKLW